MTHNDVIVECGRLWAFCVGRLWDDL